MISRLVLHLVIELLGSVLYRKNRDNEVGLCETLSTIEWFTDESRHRRQMNQLIIQMELESISETGEYWSLRMDPERKWKV